MRRFNALGSGNVKTLMGNKADLTKVIQYHVATTSVTPADLAAGKPLTTQLGAAGPPGQVRRYVTRSTVPRWSAATSRTSNATLYIVNKVLIPTT